MSDFFSYILFEVIYKPFLALFGAIVISIQNVFKSPKDKILITFDNAVKSGGAFFTYILVGGFVLICWGTVVFIIFQMIKILILKLL